MNNNSRIPVGILGATGYVGAELFRLLGGHPRVALAWATAESGAGQVVDGLRLVKAGEAAFA